jgi:DNA-binding NarL/FixJ family response regulator
MAEFGRVADHRLRDQYDPTPDRSEGARCGPGDSPSADGVLVGLIDSVRFSRDCLIQALRIQSPELSMLPFGSVQECVDAARSDLRMILYYSHQESSSQPVVLQRVQALRQAFPAIPIVVLSDANVASQPTSIRDAIRSGAQGFIPTANTAMPAAIAAIRLVRDGGTIAPVEALLATRPRRPDPEADETSSTLTPRQMTVLAHLRQGKANKIIAYELGMSESTVKVHVRNIMRRMGATNRTQAVYKSQQMLQSPGLIG